MDPFYPSEYFELTTFEHATLLNEHEPVWIALKKIYSYLQSCHLGVHLGTISHNAYLINPEMISIGKGTIVEPGAYIKGPCIIGNHCQVRHGAYIRENVITGEHCIIGHATEVKNSIFLNGVQAGHFAYVGDSILGNHVNLGAGAKCANLRFDNHHISVLWEGRRIDSGLRKFGAILGDHTQIGCNAVTNPGTLMGKESCLEPCATVQGVICKKSTVKADKAAIIVTRQ